MIEPPPLDTLTHFFLVREPREEYVQLMLPDGSSYDMYYVDLRTLLSRSMKQMKVHDIMSSVWNFYCVRFDNDKERCVRIDPKELPDA